MGDGRNGGGEASSFKAVNQPNAEPARNGGNAQNGSHRISTPLEDVPSSRHASKGSTRNSTPALPSDLRQAPQSANTPASTEPPPESQPMTATTSASSHSSAKEASAPSAAPYGTRSRNRPERASRVNYAEDVEMDFEMTPAQGNGTISEAPSRGTADGRQSPGVNGKKGAGSGNASWGNTSPKDTTPTIPGTSTFSANPNVNNNGSAPAPAPTPAPAPKRRKNASNHSTNGNHANSVAQTQSSTKRSNIMIPANNSRESNMMTFEKSGAIMRNGALEADDGQTLTINDQVYLICEPPGEPYYLCRIMEFMHHDNKPSARVEAIRVNWFYRPRDVQRYAHDTRLIYATMHSDICPLTSLRGRCRVLHRSEIQDLDDFRKSKDSFYWSQVFDRFIHRWYDAIPTSQVINVPERVKKALDERWKYVVVETSRVKELTSAVKTCKRCVGYCATNDSVECAVCHNTYHMNCVRPPLLKKPSRGFAWACGPCSRAQEKKLEARRTPLIGGGSEDAEEEELLDEEEDEAGGVTTAPSPCGADTQAVDPHPGTQAEIALAKMWPMRYLGIHCRVEDALQYDDRAIYPRASSRLGPRHQANVNVWHGRPVELVKPAEIKKRYVKGSGHKKENKLTKETVAAIEADRVEKATRPKWVQDEPAGYVHRGEDHPNKDPKCTAELQFKMPPLGVHSSRGEDDSPTATEEQVRAYMDRAKALAKDVGVEKFSTNFLDKCLQLFTKNNYDAEAALKQVKKIDKRKDLHEPELTKEEMKKWDDGVAKYGSEIRSVRLHTSKNMFYGDAVRYYYTWKKTAKGREIWGSYTNRKGRSKKAESDSSTKLLDDIAHDYDDSAFDNDKAVARKRGFQCKYCSTRASRQWRRAPGTAPGQMVSADGRTSKSKSEGYVVALCQRCANLWRKYAVKWENTDEIAKKVAQGGGKAWKRRIDEELLREVYAASEAAAMNGASDYAEPPVASVQPIAEPPRKKQKTGTSALEKDSGSVTPNLDLTAKKKEKEKVAPPPRPPTPPPVPAQPKLRNLPCAVCQMLDPPDQLLVCAACRLTVHRACYGVDQTRQSNKWHCDMCRNDKKESVSYNYECVLCPVNFTELDLYEPPKVSHKKKTDREREKERLEKELVDKAREEYRRTHRESGKPELPREPLKRTADNNWVHVYCAMWVPEPKFCHARTLDVVEGVGAPTIRYDQICKLCKASKGACVSCHQCHANFHVGCAHAAGYTFGFDVTPVKATRRDAIPTFTIGKETGAMSAGIWCKEHSPKTVIHSMNEVVDESGLTALQLFAREYKQADLTLTGTARKANLVDQSTKSLPTASASSQGNRRTSTINSGAVTTRGRASNAGISVKEETPEVSTPRPERHCAKCDVDSSPRWWAVEEQAAPVESSSLGPRVVDGPSTTMNGVDQAVPTTEKPSQPEGPQMPNGADHPMTDAPPVGPVEPAARATNEEADVTVTRTRSYLCQKCHWKKLNAPDEPEEPEKPESQPPEPQQLPLRSPPVQPYAPLPWVPAAVSHPPQQPHVGGWAPHSGPPHPPPLTNGIAHSPPTAPHLPHHQPFHPPHYNGIHQPNGYPPFSRPGVHPIPPPALQSPYPPVHAPGPPPPLHLNNPGMMGGIANGMQSPRLPYSPTHAHAPGPAGPPPHPGPGPMPSRQTESPFAGPPPNVGHYPSHRRSPGPAPPGPNIPPLNNRPSTPRDTAMRDMPATTLPPDNRIPTGGASASPSLRNLLH